MEESVESSTRRQLYGSLNGIGNNFEGGEPCKCVKGPNSPYKIRGREGEREGQVGNIENATHAHDGAREQRARTKRTRTRKATATQLIPLSICPTGFELGFRRGRTNISYLIVI